MGGLRRRLDRLEGSVGGPVPEDARERTEETARIREAAEQSNHRRGQEGEPPLFEVVGEGVFCVYDGRPVATFHQTLAEEWYWQELEWGPTGLVHDDKAEAFYAPDGRLALSRDRVDLAVLMGEGDKL